jgi:hypothetical protein
VHISVHRLPLRLQALQRTLEFEEELADRFGGSEGKKQEEESDDEGFDTKDGELTASAIRKKYKKQLKLVIPKFKEPTVSYCV